MEAGGHGFGDSGWLSVASSVLGLNGFCCSLNELGEPKVVELSSQVFDDKLAKPVHCLTQNDSFDMTTSPHGASGEHPQALAATPRQHSFKNWVQLPKLLRYPMLPGGHPDDPLEKRRDALLRVFQDFVLDLHKGLHMTQLSSNQEYSDIHCQILKDLQTLKVDQGSGCIIEFPLTAVSKVYRIVKNDDRSSLGSGPLSPSLSTAEHIVVVEFMRRKLAFVFVDMAGAQRFLICIELLIRRAQENTDQSGFKVGSPLSGYEAHKQSGERFGRSILSQAPEPQQESRGLNCVCHPLITGNAQMV
eukprot:TRINITY_DN42707_c0_g1_i1.p1 TRINITY_DN42707_c0_g1~~TRINITY_DN42707_c0_g1_i1.p1  ORF type:complete len:314 (-),score=41.59 TRINITY_DN42707_c0_g1_i1:56-964(-)